MARGDDCSGVLGKAIIPAPLINTLMKEVLPRIWAERSLMEAGELRSIGTKKVETKGLSALIFSNMGVILLPVRPRRIIIEGKQMPVRGQFQHSVITTVLKMDD